MDRLDELRIFVAVAECGSFVGAARQLSMSPPAVTRGVAALEERLGLPLFARTTRAVRLTDKGEQFVGTARRLLQDFEAAQQEITGESGAPAGLLTISASVTFGRYVLAPIVSEFLEAYKNVDVSMLLVERLVDLVDEGVDIAVRIAHLSDSSLIARRVGEVQRMLVASPAYLSERGLPELPSELARHDVIAFTGLLQNRAWRYQEQSRDRKIELSPRFEVTDAATAITAAQSGRGITGVYSYMVHEALAARHLQPVLSAFASDPVPVHLIRPQSRFVSPQVRAFMDFAVPRLSAALNTIGAEVDAHSS